MTQALTITAHGIEGIKYHALFNNATFPLFHSFNPQLMLK